jgi:hypothetical protein
MIAEVYHLSSFIFIKLFLHLTLICIFLFTKNNKKAAKIAAQKIKAEK